MPSVSFIHFRRKAGVISFGLHQAADAPDAPGLNGNNGLFLCG
jgi:hypothetical protein